MKIKSVDEDSVVDSVVGTLPGESLNLETQNLGKEMIKEAYACVAFTNDNTVTTFNTETGLMTRWRIKPTDLTKDESEKLATKV